MFNKPYSAGRMTKGKISLPDLSFHADSSFENNNLLKKPLKRYSRELSFKGFSIPNVKVENAKVVLDKVTAVLGDTFATRYNELARTQADRIIKSGESVEFVRKSVTRMVGESLAYPFVKMPFDLADFALNLMKKVPFLKKTADSVYNSKFLTNRRIGTLKDEEFNSIMGLFDQVSKKMKDKGTNIEEWIFNHSQKFSDPKTGKYNSVHERSLNRIVSGMVPAFYLANDAYNLSRFCDDNPEMAKKEHDTRFKQELSRVGITAYIQLVILGGLTKLVNSSLMGTALSSTIPVLVAETSSRLANGKSITFISKEKAKEMAKEQNVITIKEDKDKSDLIYKYYPMPVAFTSSYNNAFSSFKGTSAFSSFTATSNSLSVKQNSGIYDQTADIVGKVTAKRDKENAKDNKNKGLLSMSMLRNAILASIGIGFGVKYARKNVAVNRGFNKFFDFFKDGYNKVVKSDFVIAKKDFHNLTNKLRESGFSEIAGRYEKLMQTHDEDLTTIAGLLQDLLKSDKANFAKLVNDNSELLKKHKIAPEKLEHKLKHYINEFSKVPDDKYKLGKVDKKIKPAIDFVIAPFRFMWATMKFPYTIVNNLLNVVSKESKAKTVRSIDTMTNSIIDIQDNAKKLSPEAFKEYIKRGMLSSFNNISKSDYSNAELGKLTKLFASTVTTWFLIADDYNMVMMKSLGEDNAGASLKAKERFQQRITGIFYQTLFIDLFNNTFRKFYHASLLGMSAVTGACTVVCEIFTRKSIGKPVGKMSRDEINELEYKNTNAPGLKGKYFRFMTELTGKKAVSVDAKKKTKKAKEAAAV